ncbi:hypothetical protein TI39_contig323g00031 [Zymoseptoria brevis]|uniref:Uncharacterized protein n=1 Tax=Zymoseptoria brevis TaxID=1047168 RepID=A0A0F4GT04_9PEZI|nr:hypothetical protein TI39_contig323g00031 [Zymoseptoria brevis]
MAPDINTLPTSSRPSQPNTQPLSSSVSRRASHNMPPPTAPASQALPLRSPTSSSNERNVPLRHPRPLTAAELYLECEKEQEAVVNRLTRELTALRAQSASVASNHSVSSNSTAASNSLLPIDISDPNPTHQMTGATHPTPSRRDRSSSSASARSNIIPTPSTSVNSTQGHAGSSHAHQTTSGISQASADRAASAGISRQPSVTGRSGASTPARRSMDFSRIQYSQQRPPISRDPSQGTLASTLAQPGTPAALSPNAPGMQNFADTTAYRTEMEIVKAENEALRQRVRALERALQTRRRDSSHSADAREPRDRGDRSVGTGGRRDSIGRVPSITSPPPHGAGASVAAWAANDGGIGGVAGPRERSESQSTTASSRRGVVGVTEDDLRVGESASSVGVSRGL